MQWTGAEKRNDAILIRLAYDGPPFAGKTSSLKCLAGGLGTGFETTANEDGRTLFFDWLDYTGGRFDGRPIRCQVLGVPGQIDLAPRRKHLLSLADAVVFVADTTEEGFPASLEYLESLRSFQGIESYPRGVVIQANKRDVAGALEFERLRAAIQQAGVDAAIVESVASDGTGIREAFVLGVRLALDRVLQRIRSGEAAIDSPPVDPSELLETLRGIRVLPLRKAADGGLPSAGGVSEPTPRRALAEEALIEVLEKERSVGKPSARTEASAGIPTIPDATVPSGLIWPPVGGRILLQEVARHAAPPRRLANGGWGATLAGRWRALSETWYPEFEAGRVDLFEWARVHLAASEAHALSPRRCLVLKPEADGSGRLWQIVPIVPSLRDRLDAAVGLARASDVLSVLESTAQAVCEVPGRLAKVGLPILAGIDRLGWIDESARPAYIGFVPPPGRQGSAQTEPGCAESVVANLESVLFELAVAKRELLAEVADRLAVRGEFDAPSTELLLAIRRVLDQVPSTA